MGSARRLLVTLGALLALAACAPRPAGHVEVLRYASPYSPNHPFSRADIAWMKYVEAESGGRLKVQPFWGGALISSDQSVIELRHGAGAFVSANGRAKKATDALRAGQTLVATAVGKLRERGVTDEEIRRLFEAALAGLNKTGGHGE